MSVIITIERKETKRPHKKFLDYKASSFCDIVLNFCNIAVCFAFARNRPGLKNVLSVIKMLIIFFVMATDQHWLKM